MVDGFTIILFVDFLKKSSKLLTIQDDNIHSILYIIWVEMFLARKIAILPLHYFPLLMKKYSNQHKYLLKILVYMKKVKYLRSEFHPSKNNSLCYY